MATATDVLNVAAKEIGYREGRDANGNWNNRTKFNTWYADRVNNSTFLAVAWCAIFVSWVAWKAGALSIIPIHAWTPAGLAWFKARGRVVSTPRRGDIVYFYYASMGRVGHVGIVESVGNGYIVTIEGNTNTTGSSQGNGVYRLKRAITSSQIFCRPAYSPTITPTPPPSVGVNVKPKVVSSVSVSHLKSARFTDPNKAGTPVGPYGNEVYTLEVALFKTEWLRWAHVDGHYGSATVGDGSSGYGGVTGFQKKHTPGSTPDGWMGPIELGKLFKLAGMSVKVMP